MATTETQILFSKYHFQLKREKLIPGKIYVKPRISYHASKQGGTQKYGGPCQMDTGSSLSAFPVPNHAVVWSKQIMKAMDYSTLNKNNPWAHTDTKISDKLIKRKMFFKV